MDWMTLLVVIHIIGTVLGVGAATFAEIFLLKSMRDGTVDPVEGDFLRTTYRVIRVGLALLVVSGFGFLIVYRFTGLEARLLGPIIWSKLTIVGIILLNALLMQARKMPLWLGSTLSFASWYAAMLIVPLKSVIFATKSGYWDILGAYLGLVILVAIVLFIIRRALRTQH